MAVDVSDDVSPDQNCRRQLEFSTGSSSGLGSSLETEPSAVCALVVDEAFVTTSTGCSPCSVDTGVSTTDGVSGDASETVSTSDASDTSTCRSTVSAASNVPSVSLDALSVVAPASTVSTSMLQSVPAPGSLKVSPKL